VFFFSENQPFDGGRGKKKKLKKKTAPKRSGPIFCRVGLRLAGL
jgi:hypothetical protein